MKETSRVLAYIFFLLTFATSCTTSSLVSGVSKTSEITCPKCHFTKQEKLPTKYCLFEYSCTNCNAQLTPENGDCCVFCTYGSYKCPSIQEGELNAK